jgi:hypothetical protein
MSNLSRARERMVAVQIAGRGIRDRAVLDAMSRAPRESFVDGVALGLQAADVWPERVARLNTFFETWRSGDEYDRKAITWVMACTSQLPGSFFKAHPPFER